MSGYFDQRKNDYYDRLQYVRERGEITGWLLFFLGTGVRYRWLSDEILSVLDPDPERGA